MKIITDFDKKKIVSIEIRTNYVILTFDKKKVHGNPIHKYYSDKEIY